MDISNVNDMLVLGDLHRANTLKRDAMKLIVENLKNFNTPVWQAIMIKHPDLALEVYAKAGEYKPAKSIWNLCKI